MAEVSVCIGSETDDDLRCRLMAVLKRLDARRLFNWWGLGGSQEVSRARYVISGDQLIVETETYVGVSLIGEERVVARVQEALDG